jgi:CBS domain-containing protein
MSTPALSTSLDTLAYDAVEKMCGNQVSALLVEQNGEHMGIFTKSGI